MKQTRALPHFSPGRPGSPIGKQRKNICGQVVEPAPAAQKSLQFSSYKRDSKYAVGERRQLQPVRVAAVPHSGMTATDNESGLEETRVLSNLQQTSFDKLIAQRN